MTQPVRIQLSRAKGWRMPPNTVVVSRPSKWGNPHDWRSWLDDARSDPFSLPTPLDREIWAKERAAEAFAEDVRDGTIKLDLEALRGRNLACWCKTAFRFACHADVLLELANRPLTCEPADPAPPLPTGGE